LHFLCLLLTCSFKYLLVFIFVGHSSQYYDNHGLVANKTDQLKGDDADAFWVINIGALPDHILFPP